MAEQMFNADQRSYMAYLATLPPEKKCPCGWYPIDECPDEARCPNGQRAIIARVGGGTHG